MLSSLQRFGAKWYSSRDQLGILLALVIGLGGLIFVFFLPEPMLDLAPKIPMLSPEDWPGSFANQELSVREPELVWQVERKFFQNLLLSNELYSSNTISQEAVWYADPLNAAASLHRFTVEYEETYKGQAFVVSPTLNTDNDKPESRLFCRLEGMPDADDPHLCAYFAHWEHWFTIVRFSQEFQLFEIQKITARVDQRLMSASAEPCYWIFCTSQQENYDR